MRLSYHALFLSISLSASIFAEPLPLKRNVLILHEKRDTPPTGFVFTDHAPSDSVLDLRIALKQHDVEGLEKALYAASTPGHPSYGKHLSKDEVFHFAKPAAESLTAVSAWLGSKGLNYTKVSSAGDWLGFSLPVHKANEYLGTNFSVFTHEETGSQIIRTLAYSIPDHLKDHVKVVHPTLAFSSPSIRPKIMATLKRTDGLSSRADDPCAINMTPACVQARYAIPTTFATQSSNSLTIPGFQGNYPSTLHVGNFIRKFRPNDAINVTWADQFAAGGAKPIEISQGTDEADFDVEYAMALATGVPLTFLTIGPANATIADFANLLLEGFSMLLDQENPPQVVSTSYGADEINYTPAIAEAVCNVFMQLGARGVSLLFASGDGGVQGSTFFEQDENTTQCTAFVPTFPSGCPYVTSVGGTSARLPESAAKLASGGFSNLFTAPSYQTSAISAYLAQINTTYAGMYNPSGRGFPDVSATAYNFDYWNHLFGIQSFSGTSTSTPVFASIISLINDRLIAAGKAPLGFLNPFLYSDAGRAALNDITTGSNPGCSTEGYPALLGWDPVTGLGTPNFPALLAAVLPESAT
ncbi:family S53 protease-like protein [Mycena floridula]|nr:family S53 protease-like protein [Mycena floridula]